MYTIKQKPEDFIVKEISSIEIGKSGNYSYFTLRKRGYTTLRAVQHIAKALNLPDKHIGYAGLKDKNAVTEQAISVKNAPKGKVEGIRLKDIQLELIGKGKKPISLGDLEGNQFKIIVRDAEKEPKMLERFRNFFGEQRFSANNAKIGKAIVKKDFKNAAELIIGTDRDEKAAVEGHLKKMKNDFVGALAVISSKKMKMYVHAYQSLLWNKMAEKSSEEEIPIIGFGTRPTKEVKDALDAEGISARDFIIREMPGISSEGTSRKVFAEPKGLKIKKLNEKEYEFEFFLPKGCYATELIRQCFE